MPLTYSQGDEPVPGYHLLEALGKGGSGEVWKAVGPGGVPAAIKIINLEATQAHKELRAIQRVKFIRHPNLVPIAGMWLKGAKGNLIDEKALEPALARGMSSSQAPPGGAAVLSYQPEQQRPAQLVLAMGLGDKSLYDRLQECQRAGRTGIAPEELLDYMEAAARAIDYLNSPRHDLGFGPVAINHCDIKPQNMMIVGGAVQLCDFGLASVLGSHVGAGPIAVSPAYAAPELIQRLGPSHNTDQYSLAISYYELRTGRLPFDNDSFSEVVAAHLHGKLDFTRLSLAERLIIQRATALDPTERFRTSVDVVASLRRALGTGPRTDAIAVALEQQAFPVTSTERATRDHALVDTSPIRTTAGPDDSLPLARLPLEELPRCAASNIEHGSRLTVFVSSVFIAILAIILTILAATAAPPVLRFGLIPPLAAAALGAGLLARKQWQINRTRSRPSSGASPNGSQGARGTLNLDDFAPEIGHQSRIQVPLALLYRSSGAPLEVFDGTYLVAGTDPDCAIHLNTPLASWRHAIISAKQGVLWIQRMPGAGNPVFVNQHETQQTKLSDNDEIRVANTKLRVRVPWPHWERTIQNQLRSDLSVNADTLDPIPSKYREAAIARFLAENKQYGVERTSACGIRLVNRASIECLRRTAELLDNPSTALRSVAAFQDALGTFACAVGMELIPNSVKSSGNVVHAMARLISPEWSQLAIGDQLPIVFWMTHRSCEQIVEELHDLMSNDFARRYSLVLAVVLSDEAEIVKLRRRVREHLQLVQGYNAVVLHRREVEDVLAGQPAAEKLRHQVLDQANLSVLSPFVVGGPVPKGMFFGRENEITLVTQGILHDRGSFCIPGGRRIGKSSLLNRVSEVLGAHGVTVIYLDLSIVDSYEAFAFVLDAGHLDKSQPGSSLEQSIRTRIERERKSVGKAFAVLLLDEVDQLLRFDMSCSDVSARVLRTLSACGYCKFVLAGEEILFRALHNANSPLYNFARTVRLNMLDEKSAYELLLRPLERLRVRWDCTPGVRQRLFEVTHCHPNVLQVIGEILISRLNEADSRLITDSMIESVTCDERLRDYAWDTLWGRVPSLGRLMLLAASDTPFLPQDLAGEVTGMGVEANGRQMKEAMVMLDLYGLVERSEGGYRRTLNPVRVWGSEYAARRRVELAADLNAGVHHA